ncbi:hypothetical protein ES707_19307 [subsurface metagenome]
MPEISRFYGIVIKMYYKEHNPPHFHAEYAEFKAEIRIADFGLRQGYLPPKAMTLVLEWAMKHKDKLLEEWKTAKKQKPLFKIEPLL